MPDSHNDVSPHSRWLESAMQVFVFYSIAGYYVEAELAEAGYLAGAGFWLWSERFIAVLFTAEYVLRWWTAKNRLRHPFSLLAIIDLVAILPFYLGLVVDFRTLKLIRTLRILRLFKLYRYNRALQNVLHGFRRVKDELTVVGFVVVIVVLFSSVSMYELEHEAQPKAFEHLSDAVWWAVVTLTSVGYGDKYPITAGGRMLAILTMVIGTGIFGTFISLIGTSFLTSMRGEGSQHPHTSHPSEPPSDQPIIRSSHRYDDASVTVPWVYTSFDKLDELDEAA